jgi:hypothetical protein
MDNETLGLVEKAVMSSKRTILLNKDDDIYQPPRSNVELVEAESEKGWAGFAVLALLVIIFNTFLIFSSVENPEEFNYVSSLISYVLGGVLGLPIIVFAVSQIWKKRRNGRDRVKAILYPSLLILISQLASHLR